MNTILQILAGTWFVISSNFPMWLKGNKTNPRFHYTITERKGITVLDDQVSYLKNGKEKLIHGYDKQIEGEKFTWHGYGLLAIAKSNWEVRLMDKEKKWAVIYFSKTLVTPEGVDIISRTKSLSDETLEEIKLKMKSDSLLIRHVKTMEMLTGKGEN